MALTISKVGRPDSLRAFVELPYRLHAGTPWIPPLRLERYAYLSRHLNPFFRHGEAELFLARRDGRVVGRISAQVDRALNQHQGNRWGLFGFLEFEDDPQVLAGLLAAAEGWLRARGCDRMIGPMDFVMNEECGVLVEGHEIEPMIRQPWHPPYYGQRMEELGFAKVIDVFHWKVEIADREERMLPILPQVAQAAREQHGVSLRKMSWWHLRRELDEFQKVYNAAWSRNWGFTPYDEHDLDDLAITYRLIFARRWFMVAEKDGETIAMAITIPDINQVYQRMKGRLLPFGWWHYLHRERYMTRARIGFLGVLPEYQHTGVAALLYMEHFDMAEQSRVEFGEAGWILETNLPMNRGLEAMGARVTKRARLYERLLEDDVEPSLRPDVKRYSP